MPETARQPVLKPPREEPAFSDEALFLTDAPVPGPARDPRRAGGALTARTISDWTELEGFQEAWQELAATSAEPNPFYEPWMLLPALRAFARSEERRVGK